MAFSIKIEYINFWIKIALYSHSVSHAHDVGTARDFSYEGTLSFIHVQLSSDGRLLSEKRNKRGGSQGKAGVT